MLVTTWALARHSFALRRVALAGDAVAAALAYTGGPPAEPLLIGWPVAG